jgi:hypothetical protein
VLLYTHRELLVVSGFPRPVTHVAGFRVVVPLGDRLLFPASSR